LAAEIAKASGTSRPASAPSRSLPAEIQLLEHRDYGAALRIALGRSQVREVVREAKRAVWPHLNDQCVQLVSPKEFTRRWSGLGVRFQLAKLTGAEGLSLLGFYVRKIGASRSPLICVNTAHHPAAIGAAFTHEMGHHLVGRLFDSRPEHTQFLAYAFEEHLNDPEELAADILVSLGVFPDRIAREVFMKAEQKRSSKSAAEELPASISAAVLEYMEGRFKLSLGGPDLSGKKVQYLAALVHFAKLRRALLAEYDI
jgi:hypothetical protein